MREEITEEQYLAERTKLDELLETLKISDIRKTMYVIAIHHDGDQDITLGAHADSGFVTNIVEQIMKATGIQKFESRSFNNKNDFENALNQINDFNEFNKRLKEIDYGDAQSMLQFQQEVITNYANQLLSLREKNGDILFAYESQRNMLKSIVDLTNKHSKDCLSCPLIISLASVADLYNNKLNDFIKSRQ